MNLTDSKADQLAQMRNRSTRRSFLRNAALTSVAAAAAPLASSLLTPSPASAATPVTDADILNFALNLEYLEGEFYAKAYYGVGLVELGILTNADRLGTVTYPATTRVSFYNPFIYNYAAEIANDEIAHVTFLRNALGAAAVQEPVIDLSSSFDTLAVAAGLGSSFDPFASEENFLLGSFIFEDVGATAYHGAAGLISNKDLIPPATGIYSVECYHASIVRTTLYNLNYNDPTQALALAVNEISQLRASLGGGMDQGITNTNGSANIVPTDSNSLVFARTIRQVSNIVYGAVGATSGLFFPNGISTTVGGTTTTGTAS